MLAALAADRRFSELRGALPGVSPRALTLALKALADAGMVERTVLASYPPRTVYRLADRRAGSRRPSSGSPPSRPDAQATAGCWRCASMSGIGAIAMIVAPTAIASTPNSE